VAADTAPSSEVAAPVEKLQIAPAKIALRGKESTQQLLVSGLSGSGSSLRSTDLTREASYKSLQPQVATVDASGTVTAVSNGTATIVASAAGLQAKVVVEVSQADGLLPVTL